MSLFMFRGTGSAYWLPSSIDIAEDGLTAADLEATGVLDLTDAVNAMSGFEPSSSPINVPILRSRQSAQIPGEETFGNPQIVLVEENGEDSDAVAVLRQTILNTLIRDATGTLVVFRNTQDPETGDDFFYVRATVANQTPNFTLDAAAATTAINLTPQHELRKGTVATA